MNYFPFHIGDYVSATRHLSWDEDMAYRRMLDWCYTNEKPLPADVQRICRLVVATTDPQRAAVEVVLDEFFQRTDEGWINARVTAELARMQEKQEAIEERDEHEKTRQQKHRERRSAMFTRLSEVGVYPAWNAKTGELEKLIDEHCDKDAASQVQSDATAPVTAPVTPATAKESQHGQPATAIPIPTPIPTPTPKNRRRGAKAPMSAGNLPTWMELLVALYHEVLPELPRVVVMDKARDDALRAFWDWVLTTKSPDGNPRATNESEALAWARRYFERARLNDFIMGRTPKSPEHKNWRCSIEFLLSANGMKKVIEETEAA